jgi:hypothetical protein
MSRIHSLEKPGNDPERSRREFPKRRNVPLKIKLEAALLQLGLDPKACHLDHDPALSLRPLNETGTDFNPPQHDPRYLRWLSTIDHSLKTSGRKGESKLSVSGGDQAKAAKVKRIVRKFGMSPSTILPDKSESTRSTIPSTWAKKTKKEWPKRKWPSRPFAKRK